MPVIDAEKNDPRELSPGLFFLLHFFRLVLQLTLRGEEGVPDRNIYVLMSMVCCRISGGDNFLSAGERQMNGRGIKITMFMPALRF